MVKEGNSEDKRDELVLVMLTSDLYVRIIMCCSILIYVLKYGRPSPFQTPSDFPAKQI